MAAEYNQSNFMWKLVHASDVNLETLLALILVTFARIRADFDYFRLERVTSLIIFAACNRQLVFWLPVRETIF